MSAEVLSSSHTVLAQDWEGIEMEIKKVAVVGAGLMGTGIAQVVAEAGLKTTWIDVSPEQLQKGMQTIERLLERKQQKGRCDDKHRKATLERIETHTELQACADADLVIEAVPEQLELKKQVFAQLDKYVKQGAIIASNTSALSISALASATKRPEYVIGAHFFYPVPVMGLLEIIPGLLTSETVFQRMTAFAEKIGKTPVACKDYPGFIVNRLIIPMINEAIYLVMEGVKPEDIDAAMKVGANHPMGPITLADFVGLETLLATMEGLYEGFKDSKYRPCPLLVKMVEAGLYGRKTGRGFYKYNEKGEKVDGA